MQKHIVSSDKAYGDSHKTHICTHVCRLHKISPAPFDSIIPPFAYYSIKFALIFQSRVMLQAIAAPMNRIIKRYNYTGETGDTVNVSYNQQFSYVVSYKFSSTFSIECCR